jgi:hypothetical protein
MPLLQTKPHNRFALLRDTAPARDVVLQRMDLVAKLLDSAFVLPGINRRVGIDAILGLVPGIGDLVTTLLSSYIIWEARNLGGRASRWGECSQTSPSTRQLALSRWPATLSTHSSGQSAQYAHRSRPS